MLSGWFDSAVCPPTTITEVSLSSRANGQEKMIREFLYFVFFASAVAGVVSWRAWLKNHSDSQGEPQSIDRHKGSLPDSFFDPGTSDSPKERKSGLLRGRRNKSEFRG
jgi:hypothetical protein